MTTVTCEMLLANKEVVAYNSTVVCLQEVKKLTIISFNGFILISRASFSQGKLGIFLLTLEGIQTWELYYENRPPQNMKDYGTENN